MLVSVAITSVVISSCGGSKNIVAGGTLDNSKKSIYGAEVSKTECELLAEEDPARRAVGTGSSFNQSSAKAMAESEARATFARAIAAKIKTATQRSGLQWEKYSGTLENGNAVKDEGQKVDDLTQSIADEVVENAVIIKTNTYFQPNRQYKVFVCLQYMGDVSQMASRVSDNVKQLVPDEDRIKMQYEFNKFKEEIEKELAKGK